MDDASRAYHEDGASLEAFSELAGDLTDNLRAVIKRELEPGERLLWAARSGASPWGIGLVFWFFCAVALFLLAAAAVYLVYGATHRDAGKDFTPAGTALLGFGGVFVIGLAAYSISFLRDCRRKARVCNAVTDRRAIVWAPENKGDAIRVKTLARGQVTNLVRIERPDGFGTLEFPETRRRNEWGDFEEFKFENIPEVSRAEQIVRNNLFASGRQEGPGRFA